jgi:ABC-2 type transport system ATP-binding protein
MATQLSAPSEEAGVSEDLPGGSATIDVPAAVEVSGLSKRYGAVEAVKDISFSVARGEVFAFLGPNGAGKTTTIKMLCTLARPTGGKATVDGFDVQRQPKAVRRHIGIVFQEQTLDDQLTAEENLRFHAVLYDIPRAQVGERIDRVLTLVALEDRRSDLISTFSGGMARRLEIARGMLHTPAVLFLDEPTIGLDPQTRALMWEDVLRLRREQGVTIFLTTHYMDEAEYADRIAIIDHGSIVALDTPTSSNAWWEPTRSSSPLPTTPWRRRAFPTPATEWAEARMPWSFS